MRTVTRGRERSTVIHREGTNALRLFWAPAIALLCASMSGSHANAGTAQPVYVQYEGFIKNDNGTVTLSFGYFNMNDSDVTIAAGEDNRFMPAPANRKQPVVFAKGRHRSACVTVLPAGFDGMLRWRVRSGATESVTTAKVLDPNYALEEASARRATNGLDLAFAPRGTCLQPTPLTDRR
jgi:hypothetical protein